MYFKHRLSIRRYIWVWWLSLFCSAGEQVVTTDPPGFTLAPESSFSADIHYGTANPQNDNLPGFGLRLHWDSSQLVFDGLGNLFTSGLVGQGSPETDTDDFDGDPNTDLFVNVAWFDFSSSWPGMPGALLYTAQFTTVPGFQGTSLRFSASATATNYLLSAAPVPVDPLANPLAPPTLQSPANQATEVALNPLLSWLDTNTAPQEQGYEIRLRPVGGSYASFNAPANATSLQAGPLLEGTSYEWSARALGDGVDSLDSGWADGGSDRGFTTVLPLADAPEIAVSPGGHRFDDVALGTVSELHTFTVSNLGNAVLSLGSLALSGGDAASFSVQADSCSQTGLAPGGSCAVSLTFSAADETERAAALSIPSDDPDLPVLEVPLFGTGRQPRLRISAHPNRVMESDAYQVTVWFDQVTPFARIVDLTSSVNPAGQPGLTHPGQVSVPGGAQRVTFNVTATHNQNVDLDRTVTLIAEDDALQTASFDFTILDDDSRERNQGRLRIVAHGLIHGSDDDGDGIFEVNEDADFQVSMYNSSGTGLPQTTVNFSVLDGTDVFFPGQHSCIVGFLNPGQIRECHSNIRAYDDSPAGNYTVLMEWQDGATQHATLGLVTLVNALLPDYSLSSGPRTQTLVPGQRYTLWSVFSRSSSDGFNLEVPKVVFYRQDPQGTIQVIYETYTDIRYLFANEDLDFTIVAPYEPGTYLIWGEIDPDNLISEENEANNLSATFTLIVPQPPEPNLALSPVLHDFGSVETGNASAAQTFTVENTGNADLVLGTVTLDGTDSGSFAFQNGGCGNQTLQPAQSCGVTVVFAPATAGEKSAGLVFPSNDADTPVAKAMLAGTATAPNLAPVMAFTEPDGGDDWADTGSWLAWTAGDPDDVATIDLFFDLDAQPGGGTLIATVAENDGADSFWWDTAALPRGTYFLYAVIDDGVNPPVTVAAPGSVRVYHPDAGGLAAHWPLDEDGGSVLADLTGNGFDAAVNGNAIPVQGKLNRARSLDSADVRDKIHVPQSHDVFESGSRTVCTWVHAPDFQTTPQYVLNHYNWSFQIRDGKFRFQTGRMDTTNGPFFAVDATEPVPEDGWYFLCGVYHPDPSAGNGFIELYVDGQLQSTVSIGNHALAPDYGSDDLEWGNSSHAVAQPFRGRVDETKIWARVLSNAEIGAEYLIGASAPSIAITEPAGGESADRLFTLRWLDADADSDAVIAFYYDDDDTGADGVLIQAQLSEDDPADALVWDTSAVPEGTYYIYAVIDDGGHPPYLDYSEGPLTIIHAPPEADLGLALDDDADPVIAASDYAYLLVVSNHGPDPAAAVRVDLDLPVETSFVTASGSGWSFGVNGQTVTATRAVLDPGNAPFSVTVTAPEAASQLGATAVAAATTADPDPSNNQAAETTTVEAAGPCIEVSLEDDVHGFPGGEVVIGLDVGDLHGETIESFVTAILYDPSFLGFVALETMGSLAEQWALAVNADTPGTLIVTGAHTAALSGSGELFRLRFYLDEGTPLDGCGDLVFDSFQFNENDPVACTLDGLVCACPLGDVSGNGETTAFDAAQVLKHVALIPIPYDPIPLCVGDVTCDGTISAFDAAQILKYAALIIDSFPCQTRVHAMTGNEASIAFPETEVFLDFDRFRLPMAIATTGEGIVSFQFRIAYDPDSWQFTGVAMENSLSEGWLVSVNTSVPGELVVAAAGGHPLSAEGLLLELQGIPLAEGKTPLAITAFSIDEDGLVDYPYETLVDIRYCRFPDDLLRRLPSWPIHRRIPELMPLTECER